MYSPSNRRIYRHCSNFSCSMLPDHHFDLKFEPRFEAQSDLERCDVFCTYVSLHCICTKPNFITFISSHIVPNGYKWKKSIFEEFLDKHIIGL